MSRARLAGMVLQGVILGIFLFFALVNLFALELDARVFRYENF